MSESVHPSPEEPPADQALSRSAGDEAVPAAAAFAEAFRLQAEALDRLDRTQRRIVDTLERTDKAQHVVASTRALNETFRGLSEIQRGLLDAVLSEKGRGRWLPFAFAAVALLAVALGFFLYQEWTRDTTAPLADLTAAERRVADLQGEAERLQGREGELERRLSDAARREQDLQGRLDAASRKLQAHEAARKDRAAEVERLRERASAAEAQVGNFLALKARAA
ncbi:MAG: hypothetical protein ACE5JG_04855, partial [Planctomycetota bacterium]